jgi:hypothetical protein
MTPMPNIVFDVNQPSIVGTDLDDVANQIIQRFTSRPAKS